MNKRTIKDNAQ